MEDKTEENTLKSEIRQLYEADQQDRVGMTLEIHRKKGLEIRERDDERLAKAKEIVAGVDISDPEELNMLAYIFQHGNTVEDIQQALELTTRAVELGLPPRVSLIPQTTDRLITWQQLNEGVPLDQLKQKFGTQTMSDENGKIIIPPLNGTATKEELEKFGINS